jgi:hypothetical protein
MGKFIQLNGVSKHSDGVRLICVDADNIEKIECDQDMGIILITYYDAVEKDLAVWHTDDPMSSLLKRINEARS